MSQYYISLHTDWQARVLYKKKVTSHTDIPEPSPHLPLNPTDWQKDLTDFAETILYIMINCHCSMFVYGQRLKKYKSFCIQVIEGLSH